MDGRSRLLGILRADARRWHLLGVVQSLELPDGWIAAGFVRNAVWDHLHGRPPSAPAGDVDVIWFDPHRATPEEDRRHEAALRALEPAVIWSVKNQARMHARNGDAPYASAVAAMRCWPETATAVAVRRLGPEEGEIAAPFGLDDLLELRLRPTPRFRDGKRGVFEDRLRSKGWAASWPRLREAEARACPPPEMPAGPGRRAP